MTTFYVLDVKCSGSNWSADLFAADNLDAASLLQIVRAAYPEHVISNPVIVSAFPGFNVPAKVRAFYKREVI